MKDPKFHIGDQVVVINPCEYGGKCHHKSGEVVQTFFRDDHYIYAVRFEDLSNPRSKHNAFWFGQRSLKADNTVVNNESEETIMFKNFSVARVTFLDNPNRVFPYAMYECDMVLGDIVVVHTANHGFALARIESIDHNANARCEVVDGREIVCKVDFSNYDYRQECIARARDLKNQMDTKLREAQSMAIYEMFAEKDPALKEMIEEFKSLSEIFKS